MKSSQLKGKTLFEELENTLEVTDNSLVLFCDGGSRGNPGLAACGFVIIQGSVNVQDHKVISLKTKSVLVQKGVFLGTDLTNNQAEWAGLYLALEWLKNQNLENKNLTILMDSNLVINQIQGKWKINKNYLKDYFKKTKKLLDIFSSVSFYQILREYNSQADAQVNLAIDEYLQKLKK